MNCIVLSSINHRIKQLKDIFGSLTVLHQKGVECKNKPRVIALLVTLGSLRFNKVFKHTYEVYERTVTNQFKTDFLQLLISYCAYKKFVTAYIINYQQDP